CSLAGNRSVDFFLAPRVVRYMFCMPLLGTQSSPEVRTDRTRRKNSIYSLNHTHGARYSVLAQCLPLLFCDCSSHLSGNTDHAVSLDRSYRTHCDRHGGLARGQTRVK